MSKLKHSELMKKSKMQLVDTCMALNGNIQVNIRENLVKMQAKDNRILFLEKELDKWNNTYVNLVEANEELKADLTKEIQSKNYIIQTKRDMVKKQLNIYEENARNKSIVSNLAFKCKILMASTTVLAIGIIAISFFK